MRLLWRIVKTIFSSLFLAIVVVVGAPAAFGVTVLAGLIFLPLPATIPIPKPNPTILPTVLYDRYGHQIATLQQYDRNVPVTEAQIPQVLKEAVIADEDRNFYHHGGVDVRGTLRALYDDVRHKGPLQGGSTITQQYVKLAFTNQQRTLVRKVREAILASQLDREASKNEILYRYLTVVYFGDGNYGIGAAAENYFHVPVSALNASQAATLAGLIPAPSARAPRENLAAAEANRELVLREMHQQGYLTAGQYQAALAQRLALADGHTVPRRATVIYPLEVDDHRLSRLRRLRDPLAARRISRPRRCTAVDCGCRPPWTRRCRRPPTPRCAPPCREPALRSRWPWPRSSRSTGFVPALVGGRGFGTHHAGQPGLGRVRPQALEGCGRAGRRDLLVRPDHHRWRGGPPAGIGVEAVHPGHRVRAGHPAQRRLPRARACTRSRAARCPAGQPASACQIHNDEPGSIIGTETLSQATAESTNTVYAQVAAQVGCNHVAATAKKPGRRVGLLLDSALLLLPELRPRRGRCLPARHGVGLRRVCRPRPAGHPDAGPRDREQRRARSWSTTSARCPRPRPPCPPTWPTT